MAVQAQYLSNVLSPDFQSRVEAGGVFEGMQMLHSNNDLIVQYFNVIRGDAQRPAGVMTNATVFSDPLQSDVTCNAFSFCQKRRRVEPLIPVVAPNNQQLSASLGTIAYPIGLHDSSGLEFTCNGIGGTIHQRGFLCVVSAIGSDVSPELLALLYQQSNEIDTLVRHQCERLRMGVEASQKRHYGEILSSLSQRAMKRLREKEIELENVRRRNAELEEKTRQITAESLIWFSLAKNNEAVVSSLKTSLEQAMIQTITATPAAPKPREGYGESDCSPFPADDARSCCYETGPASPPATGELRHGMVCKVCHENNVNVLVLPCRHLCLCKSCDAIADTCPTCRLSQECDLTNLHVLIWFSPQRGLVSFFGPNPRCNFFNAFLL